MFLDARGIAENSTVTVDLCIVGAGPAGLTLAKALAGSGLTIAVLESGGREPDPAVQELAEGRNIGRDYFDLDVTRVHALGGSSNHWGGRCLPLTAHDFAERPWIPYSGWPIAYDDMIPYYKRAHDVIGLGDFDYDVARLAKDAGMELFPFNPEVVQSVWTKSKPLNFGVAMQAELQTNDAIRCFLYAHALWLETDADGSTVERVQVGTLTGNRFAVQARKFVVAAGGLENPRLLKLSNRSAAHPNGIGNQNDLVGRFFMEHLLNESGFFTVNDKLKTYKIYDDFLPMGEWEAQATLAFNPKVLERSKIANVYFE